MKKYYILIVSVVDKDGNQIDVVEVGGSYNKKEMQMARTQLKKSIRNGKYNEYADFDKGQTLHAEIEVRNDDCELLWIMK